VAFRREPSHHPPRGLVTPAWRRSAQLRGPARHCGRSAASRAVTRAAARGLVVPAWRTQRTAPPPEATPGPHEDTTQQPLRRGRLAWLRGIGVVAWLRVFRREIELAGDRHGSDSQPAPTCLAQPSSRPGFRRVGRSQPTSADSTLIRCHDNAHTTSRTSLGRAAPHTSRDAPSGSRCCHSERTGHHPAESPQHARGATRATARTSVAAAGSAAGSRPADAQRRSDTDRLADTPGRTLGTIASTRRCHHRHANIWLNHAIPAGFFLRKARARVCARVSKKTILNETRPPKRSRSGPGPGLPHWGGKARGAPPPSALHSGGMCQGRGLHPRL
jgi:hypothetical protein